MSGAPVLASVRCLSALPSCSGNGVEYPGPAPGALGDGELVYDAAAVRVRPLWYQASLQQKVIHAVSDARKRLAALGGMGSTGAWIPHSTAPVMAPPPVERPRLNALPLRPAERVDHLAAPNRKRSAADAGFAAAQLPPLPRCQPSSVHAASSSLSDDDATPTAPAGHAGPADTCLSAHAEHKEQVVEQQPPGRDGQNMWQQLGPPPKAPAAPLWHHPPPGTAPPVQPGPQLHVAGASAIPLYPAAPVPCRPRDYRRQRGAAGQAAGPYAPADQPPRPCGGPQPSPVPTPAYGGVLYPPSSQRPLQQPGPRAAPSQSPPQAATTAAAPPQGGGPPTHGRPVDWERQRARGLCSLPAPSLALQQLMARSERSTAPPPGRVRKPADRSLAQTCGGEQLPPSRIPDNAAEPNAVGMDAHDSLSAALLAADGSMRAAVEQTAAIAATHQREQLSALPAMDALLHRWPLGSLAASFGCGGSGAGSGGGQCQGGRGAAAAADEPPLLRFSHTALPRGGAAVELAPQAAGLLRSAALSRAALFAPLPADSCATRQDLWDLFLLHLQEEQSAAGPQGARAVDFAALLADGSPTPRAGGEGAHGPNRRDTGISWPIGAEEGGSGGSDDSDVYITDAALSCLASLVEEPQGTSGWQLPFLVRPRQRSQGSEAGDGWGMAAATGVQSSPVPPPVLYFAGPFLDAPGLLLDSWTRVCAKAIAAETAGGSAGPDAGPGVDSDATLGIEVAMSEVAAAEMEAAAEAGEEEDCPHCQQDEWRLGGLSLLVLSHCHVGLRDACTAGGAAAPLHLLALASAGGGSDGRASGCRAAALAAAALRSPQVTCRVELLAPGAAAMALVVDPDEGRLLGQYRVGFEAISRLRREVSGNQGWREQMSWRLAYSILSALRRLPPGPYMLRKDPSACVLELRGP